MYKFAGMEPVPTVFERMPLRGMHAHPRSKSRLRRLISGRTLRRVYQLSY